MTTIEETHILAEIRALRKEMSANAQRSTDDRTEILQKLAKNDADHEHIAEALLQINNAVYGNGTPGLKVVAQELDDRIENLEKCEEGRAADARELKKQWRLLLFGILSTVGTIIVTWLWNLVIHAN
jgi:hypothetical protein